MTRLILSATLALSSLPAYGEWVEVTANVEAGQTVYIDPDSIRRNGDIAQMSALYDSKTKQSAVGSAYLSRKVKNEYDCVQEMRRMLGVIEYSGNMASGTVVHMTSPLSPPGKWVPARAGLGETLLKIACGKQ